MRFFCSQLAFLLFCAISHAQISLISPTQLQQEPVYFQLEKALAQPQNVYKLYVDDLNTDPQDFWDALPLFTNLQMLTLEGDFFETLPEDFAQLRNRLSILIIKDNAIAQWDKCFPVLAKFRFLRSFSIENCQFPDQILSDNISLMQQVRELSLADSPLKEIPKGLTKLRRLETLDLRSTQIEKIPDDIADLKNLSALYLGISADGYPNQITVLPKAISKLKELQVIQLNQNPIRQIPAEFAKLNQLHSIQLNSCSQLDGNQALRVLATMPRLIDISISDVPLRSMPSDIKNWQDLERLDISFCGLDFLSPQLLKLPNLKVINIKGNNFPEESVEQLRLKVPNVIR
jgi:Leucine-rich repeat (LRR) protein